MFILRNVVANDLEDLFELSSKVVFINLPHDKKIIKDKITKSIKSFKNPSIKFEDNYYIFVLEDTDINRVIGVSMIHAQHGTEKEPHFFLRVSHENKFSTTINTGFVHGTLKLGLDTNGPSEIGGLILHPDYRGNDNKLGKQISFVRFLYIGLFPERFKSEVHSELMPPFDKEGKAPLWEAVGRRFMNMEYQEADILSRSNKEFILSLFPNDNIYMTLLPMKARDAIGNVGADTAPVKKMLESIGFEYTQEVDPFDGGPHYRCRTDQIKPIREMKKLKASSSNDINLDTKVLIRLNNNELQFSSAMVHCNTDETNIYIVKEEFEKLKLNEGEMLDLIFI
jgi:arginine N-succinyltransferase